MHPIEHLRYVARAKGADPVSLAYETINALRGLRHESAGIILSMRRIVQRHSSVGKLWWLCSRVVNAPDPFEAMSRCEDEINDDSTASNLRAAIADGSRVCVIGWPTTVLNGLASRSDLKFFVVESGGDGDSAVERLQSLGADATLVHLETISASINNSDLVLVEAMAAGPNRASCPAGSHAAAALAVCAKIPVWLVAPCGTFLPEPLWTAASDSTEFDVVPRELFSRVVTPAGLHDQVDDAFKPECPLAPELLRQSAM